MCQLLDKVGHQSKSNMIASGPRMPSSSQSYRPFKVHEKSRLHCMSTGRTGVSFSAFSNTTTFNPCLRDAMAHDKPPMPAPTITISSGCISWRVDTEISRWEAESFERETVRNKSLRCKTAHRKDVMDLLQVASSQYSQGGSVGLVDSQISRCQESIRQGTCRSACESGIGIRASRGVAPPGSSSGEGCTVAVQWFRGTLVSYRRCLYRS